MFRFTIRELLLLTVIVGMGVGWWIDHRRQSSNFLLLYRAMQRDTPWLVESNHADWVANQMRLEAQAKRESLNPTP